MLGTRALILNGPLLQMLVSISLKPKWCAGLIGRWVASFENYRRGGPTAPDRYQTMERSTFLDVTGDDDQGVSVPGIVPSWCRFRLVSG